MAAVMEFDGFHALQSGTVIQPDGEPATLRVLPLGAVRVRSGVLEACDPFTTLGEGPTFAVTAGDHPVFVTIADLSAEQDGSDEREAYLSVVFGDGKPQSMRAAEAIHGETAGVQVDAGTVALVDHEAVARCMPPDSEDWYDEVFDSDKSSSWFELMDSEKHLAEGAANVLMPRAAHGENVVLSHSGSGDGVFPVIATYGENGMLHGLHIDLLIVGSRAAGDEPEPSE